MSEEMIRLLDRVRALNVAIGALSVLKDSLASMGANQTTLESIQLAMQVVFEEELVAYTKLKEMLGVKKDDSDCGCGDSEEKTEGDSENNTETTRKD